MSKGNRLLEYAEHNLARVIIDGVDMPRYRPCARPPSELDKAITEYVYKLIGKL